MVIRSSVVGLPLNPTTPQVRHLHFPLEGNKVNFSSGPGKKKSRGTFTSFLQERISKVTDTRELTETAQ